MKQKYIITHYKCGLAEDGHRVSCYSNACHACKYGRRPDLDKMQHDPKLDISSPDDFSYKIVELSGNELYNLLKNRQNIIITRYVGDKK